MLRCRLVMLTLAFGGSVQAASLPQYDVPSLCYAGGALSSDRSEDCAYLNGQSRERLAGLWPKLTTTVQDHAVLACERTAKSPDYVRLLGCLTLFLPEMFGAPSGPAQTDKQKLENLLGKGVAPPD